MAFYLSPGVYVKEFDLTTIVPAVGTTEGAFVGNFVWGPVDTIVTLSNEVELVNTFGKPTNDTFVSFFSAANFLAYGQNLKVVRAVDTSSAKNATANNDGLLIKNRDQYEIEYFDLSAANTYGLFAARYPGVLGNSLKVSMFTSSNSTAYQSWEYREEFNGVPGTSTYGVANKSANDEVHIIVIDEDGKFSGTANTVLEKFGYVSKAFDAKNDDGSSNYYVNVINDRSRYIYVLNHPDDGSFDIVKANIATIDITSSGNNYSNGFITFSGGSGTGANANIVVNATGSIVTVNIFDEGQDYEPSDSITIDLTDRIANTDPDALANMAMGDLTVTLQSYVANTVYVNTNWGIAASNTSYVQIDNSYTASLAGGVDGAPQDGQINLAYDKFRNSEEVDISLVVTGGASANVVQHVIDNLVEYRRDCVAFVSPRFSDVVNNVGDEADDSVAYRNSVIQRSTSYAIMDSGWKYQFDKYNNVYRWVPLNADLAGLCVRTDFDRDPWYSPAGFNRGQIKNVVKLSWNPDKTDRDELYKNGINPVVSFPGEGVVLYGDKTMQAKPSAFDRINVRRLFIVLEKAIARAAKYSLFEFNDEFTRAQFVALVEPFLRDVQGRRGIYDFRVVCDTTNNTPEVIDRNEFIGDIYIKPARSINFIQLNFVAVRTGVAFEEIVGRF
jgi:hypothetical protein